MTGPEPWWFIAGLFALVVAGYLLPLRIEGRQDHIVVTITNGVAFGVLGVRSLPILWVAAVVAVLARLVMAVLPSGRRPGALAESRRSAGWIGGTAVACTAGTVVGVAIYAGAFGRSFPVVLTDTSDALMAATMGLAAWIATMAVRFASQRVVVGTAMGRGLDAIDSPLIPYVLPMVAGYPLIAASVAMYRPTDPFVALAMVTWCIPIYLASAFDVRRRDLARELRRTALARQRLVAIGEVSARIVHQSRHQVGLMGWSIHRLRAMADAPGQIDGRVLRAELDALTEAKDRLSETLAAELLEDPGAPDHRLPPGGADAAAAPNGSGASILDPPTVGSVVGDVVRELGAEASRAGVALAVVAGAGGAVDRPAPPSLHDVVFNVVDNAIDAAVSEVVILLGAEDDPSAAPATVVVVEDDGPGLDDHDRAHAFEPFFTTKTDGTGMGLAIADALVGDLGGELRYERRSDRTAFVVVLPAVLAAAR